MVCHCCHAPGGGYSPKFWVGVCHTVPKTWPYFRPKYMISHTPFQMWPPKSVPHFRPSFNITARFPGTGFHLHNAPLEAVWMSLVNVKITREINEHVPCQSHTLFQIKKAKTIPYFRLKQLENHALKCGTYPYSLYIGVTPHPSGLPCWRITKYSSFTFYHYSTNHTFAVWLSRDWLQAIYKEPS